MSKPVYRLVDGTYYHMATAPDVIRILEESRKERVRIRIHYGNTQTGRDWHEENDVTGIVGRSTGTTKIPLMLPTRRSRGGSSILDHCIVRIRTVGKLGKDLYRHTSYRQGPVKIVNDEKPPMISVIIDGVVHARFESLENARRWCSKMGIDRFSCFS